MKKEKKKKKNRLNIDIRDQTKYTVNYYKYLRKYKKHALQKKIIIAKLYKLENELKDEKNN